MRNLSQYSQNSTWLIARALKPASLCLDLAPALVGWDPMQLAHPPCVLVSSSPKTIPRSWQSCEHQLDNARKVHITDFLHKINSQRY